VPQIQTGPFGEEKHLSPLPGFEQRIAEPIAWSLYVPHRWQFRRKDLPSTFSTPPDCHFAPDRGYLPSYFHDAVSPFCPCLIPLQADVPTLNEATWICEFLAQDPKWTESCLRPVNFNYKSFTDELWILQPLFKNSIEYSTLFLGTKSLNVYIQFRGYFKGHKKLAAEWCVCRIYCIWIMHIRLIIPLDWFSFHA
jgi:hypothetical protein